MSAVTATVKRWLEIGRITFAPPGCPYNNPVLAAPKKDDQGTMTAVRLCIDVRLLNTYLEQNDRFILPRIPDFATFGGFMLFGEFDLSEAFTQFPLTESSRPYTAFTWDGQQYMFIGCPYGIKHIPSHFQRYMAHLFRDMPYVYVYIDNITFAANSWPQHQLRSRAIVLRLNSVNLKGLI